MYRFEARPAWRRVGGASGEVVPWRMHDIELCRQGLGVKATWSVTGVTPDVKAREVTVIVAYDDSQAVRCVSWRP